MITLVRFSNRGRYRRLPERGRIGDIVDVRGKVYVYTGLKWERVYDDTELGRPVSTPDMPDIPTTTTTTPAKNIEWFIKDIAGLIREDAGAIAETAVQGEFSEVQLTIKFTADGEEPEYEVRYGSPEDEEGRRIWKVWSRRLAYVKAEEP